MSENEDDRSGQEIPKADDPQWLAEADAIDGLIDDTEAPRSVARQADGSRVPTRVPLTRSGDAELAMWWHRLHWRTVMGYALFLVSVGLFVYLTQHHPASMFSNERVPAETALIGSTLVGFLLSFVGVVYGVGNMTDAGGGISRLNSLRLASENAVIVDALIEWVETYKEVESVVGDEAAAQRKELLVGIRYHYRLLPKDIVPAEVSDFIALVGMRGTPAEIIDGRPVTHEESPLYKR